MRILSWKIKIIGLLRTIVDLGSVGSEVEVKVKVEITLIIVSSYLIAFSLLMTMCYIS